MSLKDQKEKIIEKLIVIKYGINERCFDEPINEDVLYNIINQLNDVQDMVNGL